MMLPHLIIELTSICNLNCSQCFANSGIGPSLSFPKVKNIIKQADRIKTKEIIFTGGEPFLHRDFKDILKFTDDLDIKIGIRTNGTDITKDKAVFLSNLDNLKWVAVSLDGDETTNDMIKRTHGAYRKIIEGIKVLKEKNIEVYPSITLCKYNHRKINKYIELIKSLNIEKFVFTRFFCAGRGKDNMAISLEEFRQVIQNLKKNGYSLADIITGKFELNSISLFKRCSPCGAGSYSLTITPTERVIPCPLLRSKDLTCGSLKDDDLENIIKNSKIIRKFRSLTVDRLNICSSCSYKDNCMGGCRAKSYYTFNKLNERDPECCIIFDEFKNEENFHIF